MCDLGEAAHSSNSGDEEPPGSKPRVSLSDAPSSPSMKRQAFEGDDSPTSKKPRVAISQASRPTGMTNLAAATSDQFRYLNSKLDEVVRSLEPSGDEDDLYGYTDEDVDEVPEVEFPGDEDRGAYDDLESLRLSEAPERIRPKAPAVPSTLEQGDASDGASSNGGARLESDSLRIIYEDPAREASTSPDPSETWYEHEDTETDSAFASSPPSDHGDSDDDASLLGGLDSFPENLNEWTSDYEENMIYYTSEESRPRALPSDVKHLLRTIQENQEDFPRTPHDERAIEEFSRKSNREPPNWENYFRYHACPNPSETSPMARVDGLQFEGHAIPNRRWYANDVLSRPDIVYGYNRDFAFNQEHARYVERLASRNKENRTADGAPIFPFLSFEVMDKDHSEFRPWAVTNKCLGSSAAHVEIMEKWSAHYWYKNPHPHRDMKLPTSASFSIGMASPMEPRLYVTWCERSEAGGLSKYHNKPEFYMTLVKGWHFNAPAPGGYQDFRKTVRNIIDWGMGPRLSKMRTGMNALIASEMLESTWDRETGLRSPDFRWQHQENRGYIYLRTNGHQHDAPAHMLWPPRVFARLGSGGGFFPTAFQVQIISADLERMKRCIDPAHADEAAEDPVWQGFTDEEKAITPKIIRFQEKQLSGLRVRFAERERRSRALARLGLF